MCNLHLSMPFWYRSDDKNWRSFEFLTGLHPSLWNHDSHKLKCGSPTCGFTLSIMYSLGIRMNIHYLKLCAFVLSQVVTHLFNFIFMPQSLPQTYTLLSCPQYWPSNKKNKWPFSRHQKAQETFILLIPPCCAMNLWPGCWVHVGCADVLDDYSTGSNWVRLAGWYIYMKIPWKGIIIK